MLFWTVVLEKTLESPLDCKEIQPVHPKADQSWVFIGRADAETETPVLWPPHAKNWLIGKDPDAGNDWRLEKKGTTEDEMVGWLYGHEFEQAPGVGDGQGSLECCSTWGHKESDTNELSWTDAAPNPLTADHALSLAPCFCVQEHSLCCIWLCSSTCVFETQKCPCSSLFHRHITQDSYWPVVLLEMDSVLIGRWTEKNRKDTNASKQQGSVSFPTGIWAAGITASSWMAQRICEASSGSTLSPPSSF